VKVPSPHRAGAVTRKVYQTAVMTVAIRPVMAERL